MPVEMRMWRIDGDEPRPLTTAVLPSETALEDFLAQDPSLLGMRAARHRPQVRTPYGKYIDLLAIDADGNLHVLELKRDKTPRDVVAQVLDYGSWVADPDPRASHRHRVRPSVEPFEAAFEDVFGSAPPDELNGELRAHRRSDRSGQQLRAHRRPTCADFGVPINAVFFSYLEDDDRRYLARSWLATSDEGTPRQPAGAKKGKRARGTAGLVRLVRRRSAVGGRAEVRLRVRWRRDVLHRRRCGRCRRCAHLGQRPGHRIRRRRQDAGDRSTLRGRQGAERQHLGATRRAGAHRQLPAIAGDTRSDDDAEWVVPVEWLDASPRPTLLGEGHVREPAQRLQAPPGVHAGAPRRSLRDRQRRLDEQLRLRQDEPAGRPCGLRACGVVPVERSGGGVLLQPQSDRAARRSSVRRDGPAARRTRTTSRHGSTTLRSRPRWAPGSRRSST